MKQSTIQCKRCRFLMLLILHYNREYEKERGIPVFSSSVSLPAWIFILLLLAAGYAVVMSIL
ncbi:MAG: hypothetical protein O7F73_19515, partial [Gammaproteobacteria bacterium]|nr:hypothetical protein [Gammaproteobacteria bacterium]